MAKRQIKWVMDRNYLCVSFIETPDDTAKFNFRDIIGFNDMPEDDANICFLLFRHGLKQKLADSIAGAGKNGFSPKEQIATMTTLWAGICKGEFSTRKAAVPKMTKEIALAKLAEQCGGAESIPDDMVMAVEMMFG